MAQIIALNRAAETIARHARITITNAAFAGDELQHDAEGLLAEGVALAKTLRRELEDNEEALEVARARQGCAARQCDERAVATRENLFNLTGRKLRDPLLQQMAPEGAAGVLDRPAATKAAATRDFAERLVTIKHPRVPEKVARSYAADLRAAAEKLDKATAALTPVVEHGRSLRARIQANASYLQIQLRRLKKHWAGDGLTDTEIHQIIPDGRRAATAEEDPEVESGEADELPPDDPTADEPPPTGPKS